VFQITSPSSDDFYEEHQRRFPLTSPRTQEFVVSSRRHKLLIDPCLEDRQAHLDIDSNQDHLVLANLFLDIDPHWVLENDLGM
jgi:hypothetical protein